VEQRRKELLWSSRWRMGFVVFFMEAWLSRCREYVVENKVYKEDEKINHIYLGVFREVLENLKYFY